MDDLKRDLAQLQAAWLSAPITARVVLTPYVPPLLALVGKIINRLESTDDGK